MQSNSISLISLINPVWSNVEHTKINCIITTTQFGEEELPFTADLNDAEAHGRTIFAEIVAGVYGDIGDYVIESVPVIPITNTSILLSGSSPLSIL